MGQDGCGVSNVALGLWGWDEFDAGRVGDLCCCCRCYGSDNSRANFCCAGAASVLLLAVLKFSVVACISVRL